VHIPYFHIFSYGKFKKGVFVMELKAWNMLQCELFRKYSVKETVDIYRLGALIGHLKSLEREAAYIQAEAIIRASI
jgi:hypothetical protein